MTRRIGDASIRARDGEISTHLPMEETLQQEILSMLRMVVMAGGVLVLIGLIVVVGGPALQLVGN